MTPGPAASTCPAPALPPHHAQELFETLDTDSSGAVSLEELSAGLIKQGFDLSQYEIEQLVGVGGGGGAGGTGMALVRTRSYVRSLPGWRLGRSGGACVGVCVLCTFAVLRLNSASFTFRRGLQLRGVDANHDQEIDISEFVTTLIDWDQLEKEQKWQVREGWRCAAAGHTAGAPCCGPCASRAARFLWRACTSCHPLAPALPRGWWCGCGAHRKLSLHSLATTELC